ncbi:hypothetical protein K435DRAFT_808316 [Dendrothele bispora CBS 962.96]|uniref:Uncharacterized protein n=1 Tax=Dendrothele bispora (strain CBS 962.96) TaxID=1314807 RepID=A0A4S8L1V5_DENBC|nr:hypothetical protein K435DRAFT_808316 [Dendrothele bispora CBS 962.96]
MSLESTFEKTDIATFDGVHIFHYTGPTNPWEIYKKQSAIPRQRAEGDVPIEFALDSELTLLGQAYDDGTLQRHSLGTGITIVTSFLAYPSLILFSLLPFETVAYCLSRTEMASLEHDHDPFLKDGYVSISYPGELCGIHYVFQYRDRKADESVFITLCLRIVSECHIPWIDTWISDKTISDVWESYQHLGSRYERRQQSRATATRANGLSITIVSVEEKTE